MANMNIIPTAIRIPNLPAGPIVESNGMPSAEESNFRQGLLALLQNFMGSEGLVMPTQIATAIAAIAAGQTNNQGATPPTTNTCQYGTFIYDSTNNSIRVTINDGSGNPIFKTVTVT